MQKENSKAKADIQPIPQPQNDIFYQTENLTIDFGAKNYNIRLNSHYRYLIGFFFSSFLDKSDEFKLHRNGRNITNTLPGCFFNNEMKTDNNDYVYELNEIADNSLINLFVNDISGMGTLQIVFVLSNTPRPNTWKQRMFDYYTFNVPATSPLTRYPLLLNDHYSFINGIHVTAEQITQISFLDNIKHYLVNVTRGFFSSIGYVGTFKRFRPFSLKRRDYYFECRNSSVSADKVFFIYEYKE